MALKKVYDIPTPEMAAALTTILQQHHQRLLTADFKVCLVSVAKVDTESDDLQPALKLHGAYAAAVIKKVPASRRLLLDYDAIIEVDLATWNGLTAASRNALMDHELEHVTLLTEPATGVPKQDDAGRPKFKLQPDEILIHGFLATVERHGSAALEYQSIIKAAQAANTAHATWRDLAAAGAVAAVNPNPRAA